MKVLSTLPYNWDTPDRFSYKESQVKLLRFLATWHYDSRSTEIYLPQRNLSVLTRTKTWNSFHIPYFLSRSPLPLIEKVESGKIFQQLRTILLLLQSIHIFLSTPTSGSSNPPKTLVLEFLSTAHSSVLCWYLNSCVHSHTDTYSST